MNRKTVQIILFVAIIAASLRVAVIFKHRHTAALPAQSTRKLSADAYVAPRKLHAYDLESARELTKQPAWVQVGWRYTYYPYDAARHRTAFEKEAGHLAPLQKLDIVDVVTDTPPRSHGERQIMAVFRDRGTQYAFPIGLQVGQEYKIYADEMLFIDDPHKLYSHWSPEVWQSIDRHEVRRGMTELQAAFAVGPGLPAREEDGIKTVSYPNDGRPVEVVFRNGTVVDVRPANTPAQRSGDGPQTADLERKSWPSCRRTPNI